MLFRGTVKLLFKNHTRLVWRPLCATRRIWTSFYTIPHLEFTSEPVGSVCWGTELQWLHRKWCLFSPARVVLLAPAAATSCFSFCYTKSQSLSSPALQVSGALPSRSQESVELWVKSEPDIQIMVILCRAVICSRSALKADISTGGSRIYSLLFLLLFLVCLFFFACFLLEGTWNTCLVSSTHHSCKWTSQKPPSFSCAAKYFFICKCWCCYPTGKQNNSLSLIQLVTLHPNIPVFRCSLSCKKSVSNCDDLFLQAENI